MTRDTSHHTIEFGRERIAFILVRGDHNRFQITVQPDMKVEVQAPADRPLEAILTRVKKRAVWIRRQLHFFEQFLPRPVAKRFVGGETYRYLGRQYRLKLIASQERCVRLKRPFLAVHLPNPKDSEAVEMLVRQWYLERAKAICVARFEILYDQLKRHLPCRPRIRIQQMLRRWGSCSVKNAISLNSRLVQVPLRCMDYVIIHELCHLRFRDHGARFFRLLTRLVPDWLKIKNELESSSIV